MEPSCFCWSGGSCRSRVNSPTVRLGVGWVFTICLPHTRSPHTWFPTPPSSAPSRNTTSTRTAASPRFLVLSMIRVRHHHYNFIAIRRRAGGVGKQIPSFRYSRIVHVRLGPVLDVPHGVKRHQYRQSKRCRGCKTPCQRNEW